MKTGVCYLNNCFGTEGETKIATQGFVISSFLLQNISFHLVSGQGHEVPLCLPFVINLEMCSSGKQIGHRHIIKCCAEGQQTFKNLTEGEKHTSLLSKDSSCFSEVYQYECKWLEYFYVWQKSIRV